MRLLPPLAEDLAAWRATVGGSGRVFPHGDAAWTRTDWQNWRRRVWRPAAKAAGLPEDARPRDLRGSFASLLIASGHSVVEVAQQLGHSPVMCLNTYARAFAEYDPEKRVSAEQGIRDARALVLGSSPPAAPSADVQAEEPSATVLPFRQRATRRAQTG